jgi:hypothetical protein
MSVRTADDFWIEAGAMSGPPEHRHQIELPHHLAEFFDDDSLDEESLPLGLQGGPIFWRPLTYRGSDYGQWSADIWRLGLLTPNMGGPTYVGRVIKFRRIKSQTTDGRLLRYELSVEDSGSVEANGWKGNAVSLGSTGAHSGREYGWF